MVWLMRSSYKHADSFICQSWEALPLGKRGQTHQLPALSECSTFTELLEVGCQESITFVSVSQDKATDLQGEYLQKNAN